MKRVLTLILTIAMAVASCTKEDKNGPYNRDGSPITQAQALKIVKSTIDEYDLVYITKSIVRKDVAFTTSLSVSGQTVVPYDSWIVMIDSDPLAEGGQKWIYIYVDAYTGKTGNHSKEWGLPISIDFECAKNTLKRANGASMSHFPKGYPQTKATDAISNNWAVIISGGANLESNYERYWNNCSAMYKCLRNVYNYRKDHIFVLMSDGTSPALDRHNLIDDTYTSSPLDLDGDGTEDIDFSATRSNISAIFNYLRDNVAADEQVVIFVTDHGALVDGVSYIWLWNNNLMSAYEFADEVRKINLLSRKHLVLGQCHSGGFIDPLSSVCSNISITASVAVNESAYATEDYKYSRFLYHWISAAAEQTPEGIPVVVESNNFEGITIEEMFLYAQSFFSKNEHPQYSSTPESVGRQYGLSGEKFPYLVLSGPRHISSTPGNYLYELSGLPETYSVRWLSSENVRLTPITEQTASAVNVSQSPMVKDWVTAEVTTPRRTCLAKYWVSFWRPGTYVTNDLITGSLTDEYLSLPYYVDGTDDYDWYISLSEYDHIRSDTYFIDFTYTGDGNPGSYHVSVNFNNPLGEETTITRYYD